MENNIKPKVSVVIPIYNREKVIEPCLRSLFEQTLSAIEYIFVDDGSNDRSIEVLKNILNNYPIRKNWVKIICLPVNKGVAVARQIGIEHATGDYIIHCDTDDWIDLDTYEQLYTKAIEEGADIVGCSIRHEYTNYHRDLHQSYANTVEENIRNLLLGTIFPSLCTSLTRLTLISDNHITFPEGLNVGEDLLFNMQLYLKAKKITGIDAPFYHYTHTAVSVSEGKATPQSIYSCAEVGRRVKQLASEAGYGEKFAKEIAFRRFTLKFSLVRHFRNDENYKTWLTIAPETHQYIWQFKQYDWKLRLMLWLAAHKMMPVAQVLQKTINWQNKTGKT